jgi:hypothetical protein
MGDIEAEGKRLIDYRARGGERAPLLLMQELPDRGGDICPLRSPTALMLFLVPSTITAFTAIRLPYPWRRHRCKTRRNVAPVLPVIAFHRSTFSRQGTASASICRAISFCLWRMPARSRLPTIRRTTPGVTPVLAAILATDRP